MTGKLTRKERKALRKLRRLEIMQAKQTTGLTGEWKSITVKCPQCDGEDHVYLYDNAHHCYCAECDFEFDVREAMDADLSDDSLVGQYNLEDLAEDKEIRANLEELVSDDPETVKLMADRILKGAIQTGDKCPDCGLNAHFGTCAENRANLAKLIAENQTKNYQTVGEKKTPLGFGHSYGDKWTAGDSSGVPWWKDGKGAQSYKKECYHKPQHIIAGEGWGVWAGKKYDCEDAAQNFDVVLNLTFDTIKQAHIIPVPALAKYETYSCQYEEIQLDWPDYGVVRLPRQFWLDLIDYLRENGKRMLVFCQGGHGRTGTAIAIMLGIALGYTKTQAVNWVRQNYCTEAIETIGQQDYIEAMLKAESVPNTQSGELASQAGE